MHLVLIESLGNQQYIFSTNRLRENVGASHLLYRMGTQCVLDAVATVTGERSLWSEVPAEVRKALVDSERNRPIEGADTLVEVIYAASGTALLLTKDRDVAVEIVSLVTRDSLKSTPGLQVSGVVSEDFEWDRVALWDINARLHTRFEETRRLLPGPAQRFRHLPFVAPCAVSGLPGSKSKVRQEGNRRTEEIVSAVSLAKRESYPQAADRFKAMFPGYELKASVAALERNQDESWWSVVHADGNGIGQLIVSLSDRLGESRGPVTNRDYVDYLRRFSLALERCTEGAFGSALKKVAGGASRASIPVVPLVIAGDDLTVVCHGSVALALAVEFLRDFERLTADDDPEKGDVIPALAEKAFGARRLGAAAGITIMKSHFPFFAAYDLAESLTSSAKVEIKTRLIEDGKCWPCCALDFHVVFDSSASALGDIRTSLDEVDGGGTRLHGRPYVISDLESMPSVPGLEWARRHRWDDLLAQVAHLKEKEPSGRRRLPNSQMHDLRKALFWGRRQADARLGLMYSRYSERGLRDLVVQERDPESGKTVPSLFWHEKAIGSDKEVHVTRLLDAIEVEPFVGMVPRQAGTTEEVIDD